MRLADMTPGLPETPALLDSVLERQSNSRALGASVQADDSILRPLLAIIINYLVHIYVSAFRHLNYICPVCI